MKNMKVPKGQGKSIFVPELMDVIIAENNQNTL